MAIKSFDRTSCRILSGDIEGALQAIAAKHGIVIKAGHGTYSRSGGNFILKVECSTVGQDGTVQTKEAEDFRSYATLYNLQADDLGKTIAFNSERYTISGMRPKATRFPVLARRAKDGKVFCLPVDGVRRALEQQEPGRKKAPDAPVIEKWPHGLQPING